MTWRTDPESSADVTVATAGQTPERRLETLTSAASTIIDSAVSQGTLSTALATMAKQKLSSAIARLVDRAGHI